MDRPSLEALIESEDFGLDILHPGGLEMSRELARAAGVAAGTRVLEVAAGTGETARLLAGEFGARVTATDVSPRMIRKLMEKFRGQGPAVEVLWADARQLPFRDASFEVALAECSICQFDNLSVLKEMVRVVQPGGRVGIHDLCWKEGAPEALRQRLARIENERPETLPGWLRVFQEAGLAEVRTFDKSEVLAAWTRETRRSMGLVKYLRAVTSALKRWGVSGLRVVLESERIFASPYLGYAVVVGRKD